MQLPQMTPGEEVQTDDEPTALSSFNPLQTAHNHLYSSSKQPKKRRDSDHETKPNRRASRQVLPTPKSPETVPDSSNVKRRASRLGMFGLFNRNKALDFDLQDTRLETQREDEEDAHQPAQETNPFQLHQGIPQPTEATQVQQADSLRHRASKKALKTKDSFTRQKASTWQPPPLFQVYPQSVKHATLNTPTMPAESLIRINQERQHKSAELDLSEPAKRSKDKKLKKAHAHDLSSSRDWTLKVFALVTEGYLLQYSGRGSHDRLPEKILPLCKDSAAFATDAIQGKPFVLQISQTCGEDGAINTETSKELLRKNNLKNEVKRSSSAFLLVLADPNDMNAWLVAVRKEIEALGGKHYRSEIFGTDGLGGDETENEDPRELHRVPSQRYLVKRDPYRFSQKPLEPVDPVGEEPRPLERGRMQSVKPLGYAPANRYSMATTDSTASRYMSDTTASIDQIHLDRLRESPRQSYASVDVKTASTSRCSSLERQTTEKALAAHEPRPPARSRHSLSREPKPSQQRRSEDTSRESQQATPTPSSDGPTIRVASPPPPNFSVPSFSKRFSVTAANANLPDGPRRGSGQGHHANNQPLTSDGRPKSSSSNSKRYSTTTNGSGRLGTPPQHPESTSRPQSSGNESPFSKRNSSLNYARGISPMSLPSHSPSPHPPPNVALPPIPGPPPATSPPPPPPPPPTTPLPPLPHEAKRLSSLPAPRSGMDKPKGSPSAPLKADGLASSPQTSFPTIMPHRPSTVQVGRRPPTPPGSYHAPPTVDVPIRFPFQERSSTKDTPVTKKKHCPPPPTVPPPPLPHDLSRKSMPRLGREPPPIPPYEKPIISIIPTVEGPGEVAPHPYIPPIKLSDQRNSSGMDGPWNADYSAPKRTFLDLTTW